MLLSNSVINQSK